MSIRTVIGLKELPNRKNPRFADVQFPILGNVNRNFVRPIELAIGPNGRAFPG